MIWTNTSLNLSHAVVIAVILKAWSLKLSWLYYITSWQPIVIQSKWYPIFAFIKYDHFYRQPKRIVLFGKGKLQKRHSIQ